jgi:hypothetical protein
VHEDRGGFVGLGRDDEVRAGIASDPEAIALDRRGSAADVLDVGKAACRSQASTSRRIRR